MSDPSSGSAGRVAAVVESVAANPGSNLTEVTEWAKVPRPTVHRILGQLVHLGWVAVDAERHYYLTAHLYSLAATAVDQLDLQEISRSKLKWLREETEETVHLAVRDEDWVVFIARMGSEHPLSLQTPAGTRQPIEKMAVGRAILAYASSARLLEVLSGRLSKNEFESLNGRLDTIRRRGYEIDDEEFVVGARGIAAPIFSPLGVVGAISVVGPSMRITEAALPVVISKCQEASRKISTVLGGSNGDIFTGRVSDG